MSSKISSAKDVYQQVASDSLSVEIVFSALSDNKSLSCLISLDSCRQVMHQMMMMQDNPPERFLYHV